MRAALLATSVSTFLVIIVQSAATSRAYAVKYKERFVENTDLVGLSLANVAAGFTSTFVVNGSPTKTEMVDEAKSRTQVAQLTMAATVAIVLLFLTKPLQYLPNAVLSAVRLRDRHQARRCREPTTRHPCRWRVYTRGMDAPIFHREMPAWVRDKVATLQKIAQIYTSEGQELSSNGDISRAQDAYQEAFILGMDIVAIEREWLGVTD